jgi:hypothetical protein
VFIVLAGILAQPLLDAVEERSLERRAAPREEQRRGEWLLCGSLRGIRRSLVILIGESGHGEEECGQQQDVGWRVHGNLGQ